MRKLITLAVLLVVAIGCSNTEIKAGSENGTFIETVDSYNTFSASKLVDHETGCKFIVIKSRSSGDVAISPCFK